MFLIYTALKNEDKNEVAILPTQNKQTAVTPTDVAPTTSVTPSTTVDTPTTPPGNGNGNGMMQGTPMMGQMMGKYKDGEYTGTVADAFYGNIQVKAIISGGKITDVQFLQYPNDRSTSIMINTQAMPMLKQEAITAQSANVDIVSGATDSSNAFIQSLGSALSQAT